MKGSSRLGLHEVSIESIDSRVPPETGLPAPCIIGIERNNGSERLAAIRLKLCSTSSETSNADLVRSLILDIAEMTEADILPGSDESPTILICDQIEGIASSSSLRDSVGRDPDLVVVVVGNSPYGSSQCDSVSEARFLQIRQQYLLCRSAFHESAICLTRSISELSGLRPVLESVISMAMLDYEQLKKRLLSSILSMCQEHGDPGSLDLIDAWLLLGIAENLNRSILESRSVVSENHASLHERLSHDSEELAGKEIACCLGFADPLTSMLRADDIFAFISASLAGQLVRETQEYLVESVGFNQLELGEGIFDRVRSSLPKEVVLVDCVGSVGKMPPALSQEAASNTGLKLIEFSEGHTLWFDEYNQRLVALRTSDRGDLPPYVKTGSILPLKDLLDHGMQIPAEQEMMGEVTFDLPGGLRVSVLSAQITPASDLCHQIRDERLVLLQADLSDPVSYSLARHSCYPYIVELSAEGSIGGSNRVLWFQLRRDSENRPAWDSIDASSATILCRLTEARNELSTLLCDAPKLGLFDRAKSSLDTHNKTLTALSDLEEQFTSASEIKKNRCASLEEAARNAHEALVSSKDFVDSRTPPADCDSIRKLSDLLLFLDEENKNPDLDGWKKDCAKLEGVLTDEFNRFMGSIADKATKGSELEDRLSKLQEDFNTLVEQIKVGSTYTRKFWKKWLNQKKLLAKVLVPLRNTAPSFISSWSSLMRLQKKDHTAQKNLEEYRDDLRCWKEEQMGKLRSIAPVSPSPMPMKDARLSDDYARWERFFLRETDALKKRTLVEIDESTHRSRELLYAIKHLRDRISMYEGSAGYDETEGIPTRCPCDRSCEAPGRTGNGAS